MPRRFAAIALKVFDLGTFPTAFLLQAGDAEPDSRSVMKESCKSFRRRCRPTAECDDAQWSGGVLRVSVGPGASVGVDVRESVRECRAEVYRTI